MLPTERQALVRRVAEHFAEKYEKALRKVLDEGWSVYERKGVDERLASYMSETLPEDMPLILDPDYLEKRQFGTAPPLQAELLAQQAIASGMEPETPMLWPQLLQLPPFVFKRFQTDMRFLLRTEAKELAAG